VIDELIEERDNELINGENLVTGGRKLPVNDHVYDDVSEVDVSFGESTGLFVKKSIQSIVSFLFVKKSESKYASE
jgi:hypothetical protein